MSEAIRFAVIGEDRTVENVIMALAGHAVTGKLLIASNSAGIGDLYEELTGQFTRSAEPEPTPNADDYKKAIVALLDAKARERRYDNAVSISTYVNSTNPQWVAEASVFVAWRDEVWAYAYAELDKVTNGLRPQPTVEDFLAELPSIGWAA
ncbi:hypothetical protein [Aminobacter sp. BE322]|uniref:hypothetical protein n=1 Tax=unclassified Aminobacter TaxID=2644704 RepID=UPI003D2473F9